MNTDHPLADRIRGEMDALRAAAEATTDAISGIVAPGTAFDHTVEEMPATPANLAAIAQARRALEALAGQLAPLATP